MVLARTLRERRTKAILGQVVVAILQDRFRRSLPSLIPRASPGKLLSISVCDSVPSMSFILNPFQADIDLSNKEDKKSFEKGCQGLKTDGMYDGKRKKYTTFMKLLKVAIESVKLMDILVLGTKYDTAISAPRGPSTTTFFLILT